MKLKPYQVNHVKTLCEAIRSRGVALDASDAGTGKTFSGCGVALEIGSPVLIVTTKPTMLQWKRVAEDAGIEIHGIINYEKLTRGNTKFYSRTGSRCAFNVPSDTLIIFDEVQRCKGVTTHNAKALRTAKMQGYKILMLSATCADSPMDMSATGYALGLFTTPSAYWQWSARHGVVQGTFGREFRGGIGCLTQIHSDIFPSRGSRMRIADIADFPSTIISPEVVDTGKAKQIDKYYNEIKVECAKLEAIDGSWAKKAQLAKKLDAKAASPMTAILRARQAIEALRVGNMVELTKNALSDGQKVAIFVNFTETTDLLIDAFTKDATKVGLIVGGQKPEDRQSVVDAFQRNELDVVVCNIKAGGVGISLHDPSGEVPRLSLISPTYSAVDLIQALGRVHRQGGAGSVQKILYASGTCEAKACAAVSRKIGNINMLNDGDLDAAFL